jgi:ribosomal protein S7
VKSRKRVGGATYQVPVEVSRESRRVALAMPLGDRNMPKAAAAMRIAPWRMKLSAELLDAYSTPGVVLSRSGTTRTGWLEANKAFAHYRW